mgnify:CR=1 FL=1
MKEKIKELFKNGWVGLVVAFVITILLMTEEKKLGDMSGSWALGLITSLFTGCLVEAFRYVIAKKVIWLNLVLWALGSGIGIAIMYLM